MVLVSHGHRFIYLKTHKTAGTSVEMALEPFCAPPGHQPRHKCPQSVTGYGIVGMRMMGQTKRSLVDRLLRRNRVTWRNHMPAARVRHHLPRRQWTGYCKIAAIRNPFDRMVSYFYWRVPADPAGASEDFAQTRARFRDFVLHRDWSDDTRTTHIDGCYVIDHVVRYEHLQADLGDLARKIGIDPAEVILPVTKQRKHLRSARPVSAYFDAQTTRAVQARMGWMFERHGYSTDPRDADAESPQAAFAPVGGPGHTGPGNADFHDTGTG